MIDPPAGGYFAQEEARLIGAKPIALFTILPFYHKNGLSLPGWTYSEVSLVGGNKLQADYHGFADGYAYSPVMSAGLGRYPSPAVFSLDYNTPGYTMTLKFRSAMTASLLAAASWQTVNPDDTVQLFAYYQWGVWWAGIRCWASDGTPNDFTAYATDGSGAKLSYAANTHHLFDYRAYVTAVLFTGEFPVPTGDVESAGQLTLEAPSRFDEIVAGDHSLILSNRHRDAAGLPAPRYSPRKSSFIFAGETDWYRRQLRIDLGYFRPGTGGKVIDSFQAYKGQIRKWGPGGQGQAHTMEIYSEDWIALALERKIGLPDTDGNPQPLFYGNYLAEAQEVSGKGLGKPLKKIDFETGNLDQLSHTYSSGGGALSLNSTTPLFGYYSMRAAVTGANQEAYGICGLGTAKDEILVQIGWRFAAMPGSPANDNCTFIKVRNAAGTDLVRFYVNADGKLCCIQGSTIKETDWTIATHDGIRADMALAVKCGNPGNVSLWVGGDQVLEWSDINLSGQQVYDLALGLIQGAAAESWTLDLDDIRFWDWVPFDAYQVPGWPFTAIGSVYLDKMVYSKATLAKYPDLGVVAFSEVDADGKPQKVGGDVMMMVTANTITHPVDVALSLLAYVGLDGFIDTASFAAAKSATPDDLVGCQFEDMTAAEALTEITQRCLYNLHVDHGEIRLIPYLGAAPVSAVLSVGPGEIREIAPTYDMDESKEAVVVKWGWQERNPDLTYTVGDPSQGEAEELDFTWGSPVATQSEVMAKAKADALLKRLRYGKEVLEPMRLSLRGARLELGDGVEIDYGHMLDSPRIYETLQKIISLEPPYETSLRLVRFLGE